MCSKNNVYHISDLSSNPGQGCLHFASHKCPKGKLWIHLFSTPCQLYIYIYIYILSQLYIHIYIHIYIYIDIYIIIIMSLHQHGYPWSSLATPPYCPSFPAGPQGFIPYLHRAAVSRIKLIALPLLSYVKGSTRVNYLWARPYFTISVPHVWFI